MMKFLKAFALLFSLTTTAANAQSVTLPSPYTMTIYSPVTVSIASVSQVSVVATFICESSTSGSTVLSIPNSLAVEAGRCDGKANPSNSSGAHAYVVGSNTQASATWGLTPGVRTTMVVVHDGYNLSLYVFQKGVLTSHTVVPDKSTLNRSTSVLLGATSGNQRLFQGALISVALYPPFNDAQARMAGLQ